MKAKCSINDSNDVYNHINMYYTLCHVWLTYLTINLVECVSAFCGRPNKPISFRQRLHMFSLVLCPWLCCSNLSIHKWFLPDHASKPNLWMQVNLMPFWAIPSCELWNDHSTRSLRTPFAQRVWLLVEVMAGTPGNAWTSQRPNPTRRILQGEKVRSRSTKLLDKECRVWGTKVFLLGASCGKKQTQPPGKS